MNNNELIFKETQKLYKNTIVLLIIPVAVFIWFAAFYQLVLDKPLGNNPAQNWLMLTIWIVAGVMLPYILLIMKMTTKVYGNRIEVGLLPFIQRKIFISNIKDTYERTSDPVGEYGGWGYRYNPIRGYAFTVFESDGVQLTLNQDKDIFIGSQNAAKLLNSIKLALSS